MSSDQRPAKMRMVSAGQTPARRRGDQGAGDGLPGGRARADGLGGAALITLFLIGCIVGGAVLILSGLVSAADF